MAQENLFEVLHVAQVEQAEFEQIVLGHFGRAMGLSPTEIVYPGHESNYALCLRYTKRGKLVEIRRGPKLTSKDIATLKERIQNDLMTSAGRRIGCAVLFASVPCEGFFRYQDLFQIVPVPPEAPRPPFTHAEHPFLLEFRFTTSSNFPTRLIRRSILERELELVLAAILPFSIGGHGRMARHHWVLPPLDTKSGAEWRSSYCKEGYDWNGLCLESEHFTTLNGISEIPSKDPAAYYDRHGIGAGDVVEVPSNITELLDRFFALPSENRDQFLRASFWFQHAGIVHSHSRSAAFTALISSVEALLPDESVRECEACHRPLLGLARQFAEFVNRYVPLGSVPETERKKFYDIRSRLSHGESLLPSDQRPWHPGPNPAVYQEFTDIGHAWQIVTLTLVNWLGSQEVQRPEGN